MRPRRVSLVLGAGGARGYAHIGAIAELTERGYEIVAVAGSSMGRSSAASTPPASWTSSPSGHSGSAGATCCALSTCRWQAQDWRARSG